MSVLQWEQYRRNATNFVHEWAHETDEKGEAKSYWDAFFMIFNINRRHFARHEGRVKMGDNNKKQGFIDTFWPGKLLVEHKSAHKNSEKDWEETYAQAIKYVEGLPSEIAPKHIILCNFRRFRVFEGTKPDSKTSAADWHLVADVDIKQLPENIEKFAFFPEYADKLREEEERANIEAAQRIGTLHKVLRQNGYGGHDLELFLVRVLFCLFAEDTGIFDEKQFTKYIEKSTLDNGTDLGAALEELFEVLNTSPRRRADDLPEVLRKFVYVNGGLFAEPFAQKLPSTMGIRNTMITLGAFGWGDISPEIFGSLFQAALSENERRTLGAHYTSERNIRRLVEPLFLDNLWAELKDAADNRKKLETLRQKLRRLRILDPACGCGNFLVVTYRELRLLDQEIVKRLQGGQYVTDASLLSNVTLTQFYGLEIKPVSALIAQTALWLTEHQCNLSLLEAFGKTIATVPLDDAPNIKTGNALQVDWEHLLPTTEKFTYIIGNPPFIGAKIMDDAQRIEIKDLFGNVSGSGTLDYVTGWYKKAANYMDSSHPTHTAFVSTNSISQGEQVGMLWGTLMTDHKVKISFAHQTFKWTNEAPGVAAVYCIIVGFGRIALNHRTLFEYDDIKGEPIASNAKNINPYFVDAPDIAIRSRQKPLCNVPEIGIGNKPIDGGYYLFSTEDRDEFIKQEPRAAQYFRRWIGSDEFINGWERWCLWLGEEKVEVLKKIPKVWERVLAVQNVRLESKSPPTQKLALKPTRFHVENIPTTNYLVIPETSSERRLYIPFGYEKPTTLASNAVKLLPNASVFLFGVLTSEMHMSWVRYVCGRLESRYRYSKDIVYNNFPFPQSVSDAAKALVEKAAEAVLAVRAVHQSGGKTLAQLYDPDKMPSDLLSAHTALDRAVDACYGVKGFKTEAKRVAFLFGLYEALLREG